MQSKAATIDEYLAELPEVRRIAISAVREVILDNLHEGYEEAMLSGVISYHLPHSVYPPGYHCNPSMPLPFIALASQKNYMALYLMCIYSDKAFDKWFREAWSKSGKKLDMGKSCVRFKKLDDVPLDVIGKVVKRVPVNKLIKFYESAIKNTSTTKRTRSAKKSV